MWEGERCTSFTFNQSTTIKPLLFWRVEEENELPLANKNQEDF